MEERADKLENLRRELTKINHQYLEAEKKEVFLSEICKFVNM
jgi:septum formation topological specificity factor MinE